MSCPKWRIDIALYAGGDLPPRRRARTAAHLEACVECRALADDFRNSQMMLDELRDEELEGKLAAQVRRRVLARLPIEAPGIARRYWTWALAAGLVLAATLILPRRTGRPAPIAPPQIARPLIAAARPTVVNVRRPAVRRHHHALARRQTPPQLVEPLLVQLVTDDPNIVIYWLVDPKPEGD